VLGDEPVQLTLRPPLSESFLRGEETGRTFCPDPASKLYDIYHCCVYSEKTPDDGQRNRPKHVKFYSKKINLRNLCI